MINELLEDISLKESKHTYKKEDLVNLKDMKHGVAYLTKSQSKYYVNSNHVDTNEESLDANRIVIKLSWYQIVTLAKYADMHKLIDMMDCTETYVIMNNKDEWVIAFGFDSDDTSELSVVSLTDVELTGETLGREIEVTDFLYTPITLLMGHIGVMYDQHLKYEFYLDKFHQSIFFRVYEVETLLDFTYHATYELPHCANTTLGFLKVSREELKHFVTLAMDEGK